MGGLKMFKKILIATDLSKSSDAVINCIEDFKTGYDEFLLKLIRTT
jgi:hypothetical protein